MRVAVDEQLAHHAQGVAAGRAARATARCCPTSRRRSSSAAPHEDAGREEMRAALYALALSCGDPAFGEAIGIEPRARSASRRPAAGGRRWPGATT